MSAVIMTITRLLRISVAGFGFALGLAGGLQAAPTVTLTAPDNGWSYNAPANLTLRATAATDPADAGATVARVEFYVDGVLIGSDATSAYTKAWSATNPGSHILTAKAVDSLGQETVSAPVTVTVTDSTTNLAPTVSLTAPANNAKYALPADITLTASAADVEKNGSIAQVEFLADGQVVGTVTAKPYSVVWSNPPGGTHTLTARATDNLGAMTISSARTLVIQATNTPPTVSLGGVTAGTYVLPVGFALTASASGGEVNTPVTQVEFLANDQVIATVTAKPYSVNWNPPAGTYVIAARATDNQGLTAVSTTRSVTVNASNTPPTVGLTAPANNSIYVLPADIVVSANASDLERNDGVAKVEFFANGQSIGAVTAKPYSVTWSNPAPGSYSLTAVATDTLGGRTTSAARPVTLQDTNAPPKVGLTAPANKASFVAPASITLTASVSGPEANTPVTQVEFLADGQVIATLTAKPYTTVWTNVPVGSHSLTVRATDSLGAVTTSAARTITVTANQLPTVALISPSANRVLAAPATVTVTAAATDTDGTVAKVDFYAGPTLIGTATSAPYSVTWSNAPAGSYSLTAVATDDKGGITTSAAIGITLDTPPSVSLTGPSVGSVGIAPASFLLTANAADADGSIAKVEFYAGTTLIGTATSAPYSATWSNAPAGSYNLTAVATDNLGLQTTSSAITVSIIANTAPSVTLTSPSSGQSYKAPATMTLTADASDAENNLAKVEFFQNGMLIATVLTPPYSATWSNVVQGNYSLTALATDAAGVQTTSSPVTITVSPAQASLYFIHPDHLGTPRLVTDGGNAIVWRNLPTTEPFGNTPPEEDPNGTGQRFELPLAFPGQYRDRESNLSYNYFRDYDPSTGRYVQSDPIGLGGGVNTYTYVGGNPISRIDPTGKVFFIPALIGAAMTGEGAAILGGSAVLVGAGIWMANNLPPGFWPGDKGAEEWGRRNDVGAKGGRDIFHDIKRGNRRKPGSRAADNCGVNPDTGEVVDGNGEHIGDLGDGH